MGFCRLRQQHLAESQDPLELHRGVLRLPRGQRDNRRVQHQYPGGQGDPGPHRQGEQLPRHEAGGRGQLRVTHVLGRRMAPVPRPYLRWRGRRCGLVYVGVSARLTAGVRRGPAKTPVRGQARVAPRSGPGGPGVRSPVREYTGVPECVSLVGRQCSADVAGRASGGPPRPPPTWPAQYSGEQCSPESGAGGLPAG